MPDENYGDGQGDGFDVEPGALKRIVRQLLAAVMLCALADALGGDDYYAVFFMDHEAPAVARALGIDPARVARWRQLDPEVVRHTIGLSYEEDKRQ